jgi:hypothetical protein
MKYKKDFKWLRWTWWSAKNRQNHLCLWRLWLYNISYMSLDILPSKLFISTREIRKKYYLIHQKVIVLWLSDGRFVFLCKCRVDSQEWEEAAWGWSPQKVKTVWCFWRIIFSFCHLVYSCDMILLIKPDWYFSISLWYYYTYTNVYIHIAGQIIGMDVHYKQNSYVFLVIEINPSCQTVIYLHINNNNI